MLAGSPILSAAANPFYTADSMSPGEDGTTTLRSAGPTWSLPALSALAVLIGLGCVWAWASPTRGSDSIGPWVYYPLGMSPTGQGLALSGWVLSVAWFLAFGVLAGVLLAQPHSAMWWAVITAAAVIFALGVLGGVVESFLPPPYTGPPPGPPAGSTRGFGLLPLAIALDTVVFLVAVVGPRMLLKRPSARRPPGA